MMTVTGEKTTEPRSAEEEQDESRIWIFVCSGLLSACALACLTCKIPDSHTLSARAILVRSAVFVSLSILAGVAGVLIVRIPLRHKPSNGLVSALVVMLPGALFIPSIALLYRQNSSWSLPIVSIVTALVILGLRRCAPESQGPSATYLERVEELPNLYGLPPSDARYHIAALIALFAQAALFCSLAGLLLLANALLALAVLMTLQVAPLRPITRQRAVWKDALLSLSAFLLTAFTLVPWMGGHRIATPIVRSPSTTSAKDRLKEDTRAVGSDYVGIVLLAPPINKQPIVPPAPLAHSVRPGSLARPIVIPFDGTYWYFKAPATEPGPHAHLAHGLPTESNVRSSDRAPLLMQAHQNLGTAIDLTCCSAIDLSLTNADIRTGAIQLGVLLTDSTSPGRPTLYLGAKVVVSSTGQPISFSRAPVKEILRFPIGTSRKLAHFDEITVVYLPAWERGLAGAKLSLQSFTLLPR